MDCAIVEGSELEKAWKNLLAENPSAPPQLSLEWRDAVLAAYPRLENAYCLVGGAGGYEFGFAALYCESLLFGNRVVSLPFVDHGGFVGEPASAEGVATLFSRLRSRFSNKFEVRLSAHSPRFPSCDKSLLDYAFLKKPGRYTAVLELRDENAVWQGFSRHVRKNVNKAERSGLVVKAVDSQAELDAFYREYLLSMKRFGTPPHSKKFFEQLSSRLGVGKNFFGFNCYHGGELAGSLVMMRNCDTVILPYGVSPPAFREHRPNDLLHWTAICKAMEVGAKHFDLGLAQADAPPGSHAAGILEFKLKLGCKLFERPSYSFGGASRNGFKASELRKAFSTVWSKLPLFLTERVGPWVRSQSCV